MPIQLPCEVVRTTLNDDPEFQLTARLWTATLKLVMGDVTYLMKVEDGVVTEFTDEPDHFDPYSIVIGGPEDGWEKLLSPVPPPFYQDFWGAFFRHGFEMGGDLPSLYASYGAVRRTLELLRAVHNDQLQEA